MNERGTLWYTKARATLEFFFPENKVECKYCRYLRADANGARYKCTLTDEILGRIDRMGTMCPVEEIEEQKGDENNGNGQRTDEAVRFLEDCPF